MKFSKFYIYLVFTLIVLLFSYFRLTIINSGNVAYTYDQGRDFLAGSRIITDRNPVFIGPTTGIGGLFHGAWWYYVTAASYLILGANPLSYYHFLFGIHLATLIIWLLVIKKYLGDHLATISGIIITAGSYYIGSHTFAGNNILAIPSFTFFCLTLLAISFESARDKSHRLGFILAFVLGLTAAFVAETELSFGIFITPAIISLFVLSPQFRRFMWHKFRLIAFVAGVIIPFAPRLLFEIKNNFLQTKVLLGFFTKPKLYNPKSYTDVFFERIETFRGYISQSVGSNIIVIIGLIAATILIFILISRFRRSNMSISDFLAKTRGEVFQSIYNLIIILLGLFVFSLVYRDPFWGNYYEGIQAGFLLLFTLILSAIFSLHKNSYRVIISIITIFALQMLVDKTYAAWSHKTTLNGLNLQQSVIRHIVDTQSTRNSKIFCARVFTPPVIPHTYDYLWFYYYKTGVIETPRYDYIDNKCWYIIEPEWDGFDFRRVKWQQEHIPKDAKVVPGSQKLIGGITVAEYELHTDAKSETLQ